MSNGSPCLIHVFRSVHPPSIHLQLQRSHKPGCASSRSGALVGRGGARSACGPKGFLTPTQDRWVPRRQRLAPLHCGPELQVDSQQYVFRQCAKAARPGGARSALGPNFRRSISSKAHSPLSNRRLRGSSGRGQWWLGRGGNTGWLCGWLAGWLVGRLVVWMVCWLAG